LGLGIIAADRDGVQFVASDMTVQDLFFSRLGIEEPPSIFFGEGNWEKAIALSRFRGSPARSFARLERTFDLEHY